MVQAAIDERKRYTLRYDRIMTTQNTVIYGTLSVVYGSRNTRPWWSSEAEVVLDLYISELGQTLHRWSRRHLLHSSTYSEFFGALSVMSLYHGPKRAFICPCPFNSQLGKSLYSEKTNSTKTFVFFPFCVPSRYVSEKNVDFKRNAERKKWR